METISTYTSEWGKFEIPKELFLELHNRNMPTFLDRLLGTNRNPVWEIAPRPKNAEFWDWLHKKEIESGKPIIPSKVWEEASAIGLLPREQFPEYFALRFYEYEKRISALEALSTQAGSPQ